MECTGRTGMCGKDANECKSKVGCDSGLLIFCDMARDAEGKVVKDAVTGTAKSQCVAHADCTVGQEREPVPTTKILNSASGGSLEDLDADGKQAMKLKVPPGGFKVGDEMKAVNFSIAKVFDSLVQLGSFGKLFQSSALVGSLITIEPSAAVDVIGGISLDIPILDQSASTDLAKCALLLKSLQVLSVNDISDVNAVLISMGNCSKGDLEGCSYFLLLLLVYDDLRKNIEDNPTALRQIYEGLINFDYKAVVPSLNFQDPQYKPASAVNEDVKSANRDLIILFMEELVRKLKTENRNDEVTYTNDEFFKKYKDWCVAGFFKDDLNKHNFGMKVTHLRKK
jgi:hypothetical protein